MATRRKPVPLEPESPGMDPMHISKVAPDDLWTDKDPKPQPKKQEWPTVPGYTNRIFAANGKPIFGTWAGPQGKFWDYKGRYGFMGGGTYTGKALDSDTDIPTPMGWKKMRDLNAGDLVYGVDGRTTTIIAATEEAFREAFEVRFADNTSIVADGDHLWKTMTDPERVLASKRTEEARAKRRATRLRRGTKRSAEWVRKANSNRIREFLPAPSGEIRTTTEIARTLHRKRRGGSPNHCIDQHDPIAGTSIEVPIPPYTLGAWLGDGHTAGAVITTTDEEILDGIRSDGFEIYKRPSGPISPGIGGGFQALLRESGLKGRKRIPPVYLRASLAIRLALFQGIMDTDGTCDKRTHWCSITLKDGDLFAQVVELARTLGIIVNVTQVKKVCTNSKTRAKGTYWHAGFMSPVPPFRLKRKLGRWRPAKFRRRFIHSVTPVGKRLVKCIKVDAADGMYLAGRQFIPTHNTDLLRWYPWQQIEEDNARIKNGEITESFGQALYLLRETPRLREVMNRCARDYKIACPEIAWKAMDKTYVLPSGYRITFGHMENDSDWDKYQGWQITCLLWDELPSFLLSQWDMMDQWVRQPGGSLLTPIQRAGGNPIGVGRQWVKKFFVDFGSGKEITKKVEVEIEDADGKKHRQIVARSRMFVYAKVSDNKSVDQAAYLASFDGKPAALVRAMRDGDFSSALGELVGRCWDEEVHVTKAFAIPATRRLFRSCFFSYAETTVHWWATDYDGNLTCYRELHLTNHTAKMVAERIREIEEEAKEPREWSPVPEDGSKLIGVLGPETAWERTKQRGPSPAETMRRVGIRWSRADENLGAAADQIRDRLLSRTLDGTLKKSPGVPGLRYFDSCAHSIEEIPSMPADKNDADLPDPKAPATAYRSTCYAAMSRPITPEMEKPSDDDWDRWTKPKSQRKSRTGYPGLW